VTHGQVCEAWTSRDVVADEELMWSFPPSAGYVYEEFDPQVTPVQFFGSSVRDQTIPNIGISKVSAKISTKPAKDQPPASKTPATAKKRKPDTPAVPYDPAHSFASPDQAAIHEGAPNHSESDADESHSESSAQSSDNDNEEVAPQPVYDDDFTVPVWNAKRKINIEWKVKNSIASDISAQPFSGETKLLWKAIGLGGFHRKKTELECFMLMDVPIDKNQGDQASILALTNAAIDNDEQRRGTGNMTLCAISKP
jgi:hypothetical protein